MKGLNTERWKADISIDLDSALQNSILATKIIENLTSEFDLPNPIIFSMMFYLDHSEIALRHESAMFFKAFLSKLEQYPNFSSIKTFVQKELLLEIW